MDQIKVLKFLGILLCASVWSSGCGNTRTILIPNGEPVQLAEPVEARVYVSVLGERINTESRVEIPEGWWCLPDPGPE